MMAKYLWITLLLGVAACQRSEGPASGSASGLASGAAKAQGGPVVSVHTVLAKQQEVPVQLQANATVQALSSVELHPQLTSTILKVHVAEGQFVKAGQVLFTLDARNERANLDKARAQLARDSATLVDLQRQHQRSLELVAKKFVTQSNADTLGSQVEAQRALLASDQAAIDAAAVALGFNAIRAPQAGRVGEIRVFPGTLVQLNTVLLTITQMDPIALSFTVPESELSAVLAAHKAGAVPVLAKARGVSGKLSFIDNTVDAQSGVVKLKAQFDNHDLSWWPGQYADVQLTVKTLKAVVVPQAAIINSVKGTFVYQVTPEATAKVVPVKVLYSFGAQSAVSGLAGGEKIIVEGKQNLRPGGKVQVVAAPGGSAAGRAGAGSSSAGSSSAGSGSAGNSSAGSSSAGSSAAASSAASAVPGADASAGASAQAKKGGA
jgi:RND family efflux transporter MFP subunit